ncbi:MAG: tRNA (adenosine(37)-N6)-threonylcarbamoyltransferase complex transferase subunit TsaD, partial [Candidatus Omnitrophica bacterium]|nr:tRNA (adenosine(37)-N6)-threonylcarbamoyltransferase complex transferase subunit TsaD [Candidatus Omnitrophota bacterium]
DAVGEAFDKVAKLLGLGYPGGPAIDRISDEGDGTRVRLPRGQTKRPFDFSFSGLKTAVYQYVQKAAQLQALSSRVLQPAACSLQPDTSTLEHQDIADIADIAAGFQEAAVDILITKTLRACHRTGIKRVAVGGGVASNRRLRARFGEAGAANKLDVIFPPPPLCVDNGAMVAGIGYPLLQKGRVASLSITSDSNLCLN